jgi:hypothetical protein
MSRSDEIGRDQVSEWIRTETGVTLTTAQKDRLRSLFEMTVIPEMSVADVPLKPAQRYVDLRNAKTGYIQGGGIRRDAQGNQSIYGILQYEDGSGVAFITNPANLGPVQ